MNHPAIDITGIHKSFGNIAALRDMQLKVKPGTAMALLGENGAGKTTLLRILTNLYRADSGEGTILGQPLGCDESSFFQRIGYVSENQRLPLRWTLQRLIDYLKPQYPTWDDDFCRELVDNFDLPLNRHLGKMSRGMQMKSALVSSLAYRPELLMLDEPFSGLDPLVREDFIDGVLELMGGGDWTLLLSSHDIHEVERLCDEVTIIDQGRAVVSEPLDSLQKRFCRWSIHTSKTIEQSDFAQHWLMVEKHDEKHWSLVEAQHDPTKSLKAIEQCFGPLTGHESQTLSLRDIYLVLARDKKRRRHQAAGKSAA